MHRSASLTLNHPGKPATVWDSGTDTAHGRSPISLLQRTTQGGAPPFVGARASSSEVAGAFASIETPIGPMFVAYNGAVISAVRKTAAAVQTFVRVRFDRPAQHAATLPEHLGRAISEYLQGTASAPLEYDLTGLPEFDRSVLHAALATPRGEVRTYGQLAHQIGQPGAARDVGAVLGHNPIPLLIPCHRIVYSDGRLGGYMFGSRAKQTLLRAEGIHIDPHGRVA